MNFFQIEIMKVYLKKIDKYNNKKKIQIKWWIMIYKLLTFNTIYIFKFEFIFCD